MQLPPDIRVVLEELAREQNGRELRAAAGAVSERYRERGGALQIANDAEARAYLATRFPATYAAAKRAMQITRNVIPGYLPQRMLDVGAGPGTVALAAREIWSPGLITLIEPNEHLRAAGQVLLDKLFMPAEWMTQSINHAGLIGNYDLVTAGYVLNELSEADLDKALHKLWKATGAMLLLIEPGTPQGSKVIQRARDLLTRHGAFILAPCPQSGPCPLRKFTDRWCHFSVRVERSRLHRQAKEGSLPYEDEKFSFIAFGRKEFAVPSHRIIGHPSGSKVLQLQVCDSQGEAHTQDIPKSDLRHKELRRLEWGDGFGGDSSG